MVSVAHQHRVRVPSGATRVKPKDSPRCVILPAPLTHAAIRVSCFVKRAQCVICDDHDRPLEVGTPSPRVDPRCSASELHGLWPGPKKSSDTEIAREERAGKSKAGLFSS
jgi:hypothetical protein